MKKLLKFGVGVAGALFFLSGSVFAMETINFSTITFSDSVKDQLEPFQEVIEFDSANVDSGEMVAPSIVEIPMDEILLENTVFAVLEKESQTFEPYYFYTTRESTLVSVEENPEYNSTELQFLVDGDTGTFVNFDLSEDLQGAVTLTLLTETPVTSESLFFRLSTNVALPKTVSISVGEQGKEMIVLAPTSMENNRVFFPETIASRWVIQLEYVQPLRLTEIVLDQKNETGTQGLRFLAQPQTQYLIFLNPDSYLYIETGERGNLQEDDGVKKIESTSFYVQKNPLYEKSDVDNDGIPDEIDNCVDIENSNQEDLDENGRGDPCDDYDRDNVLNEEDNCQNDPNRYQEDIDNDGLGDVCDTEESRLTERMPWLPWTGMGLAALVIVGILWKTMRSK